MARCKMCNFPDRQTIETKILAGTLSMLQASKYVGCSVNSIKRHMDNHVGIDNAVVASIPKNMNLSGSVDAFAMLTKAVLYCDEIIETAKQENNIQIVLLTMSELRKTIETMGKLFEIQKTGEKELASNKVELTIKVINEN